MNISGIYYAKVARVHENGVEAKLFIPSIFGSMASEWARPLVEGHLIAKNDRVWALFEGGEPGSPLYVGGSSLNGFHRATVVEAGDPITLSIPSLFGDQPVPGAESMTDAEPPEEGAFVWATFEAGDALKPLYLNPQANAHYHGATSPEAYAPESHGHE